MKRPTLYLTTLLCLSVAAATIAEDTTVLPLPLNENDASSSDTTTVSAVVSPIGTAQPQEEETTLIDDDDADDDDDDQSQRQVPAVVGHHSFVRQPSPLPETETEFANSNGPFEILVEASFPLDNNDSETVASESLAEPPVSQKVMSDSNETDAEASAAQVDQLQLLLLQQQQQRQPAMGFGFGTAEIPEDDRTLLDVFGEVAKEYLTQHVIPDTDAECVWDWRSTRCEPACECNLQAKWGDYHFGRACRYRPNHGVVADDDDSVFAQHGDNASTELTCVHVDPATVWKERPATRRIVSLVVQTSRILRIKSGNVARKVRHESLERLGRMQTNICSELWTMVKHQTECLPGDDVPIKTIPERILCGPVEFVTCEDEHGDSGESSFETTELPSMARRAWTEL